MLAVAVPIAGGSACLEPPEVDLVGPTIVAASLVGPRTVELPVVPTVVIEVSEPIDPASIHAGSVALVAWEPLGSCALTPVCAEGSCERGTCQRDPLRQADRRALDRGESAGVGEALELLLSEGPSGPDTVLTIRPRRPLAEHRRHSLILGAAVRDRSGAPLVDEHAQIAAWSRDFVTAGRGSSGPQPHLRSPAPGEQGVATNLAQVETELWPPVPLDQLDATLILEPEGPDADRVELVEPVACPGWAPGTCLRWRPAASLAPDTRYRLAGGSLVDRFGRRAQRAAAAEEAWFASGPGPDLDAPTDARVDARLQGRCVAFWIDAGEAVAARLEVDLADTPGASSAATIAGAGWLGLALPRGPLDALEVLAWSVELRDRADNAATITGELPVDPSLSADSPDLTITEILANPLGPEPEAEFVELLAGPAGAALAGVHLADASPAAVWDAWAAGEPVGDPLPAVELSAGERALIVADAYGETPSDDVAPAPGTRLLRVDASLGDGGLRNAGEPLTLWLATDAGPVVLSSYGDWIDPSPASHAGRSVVAGPDGCDLPDRWRSHPLGRASPGSAP